MAELSVIEEPERAGFVERGIAWAVDLAVLSLIVWLAAHLLAALAGWSAVGVTTVSRTRWAFNATPLFMVAIVACALGYNFVSWRLFDGGSVGKRIFGLRVRNEDGGILGGKQVVGRTFGYLLSLPCFIGFIWAAFDSKHQALHDKLVGTAVFRGIL